MEYIWGIENLWSFLQTKAYDFPALLFHPKMNAKLKIIYPDSAFVKLLFHILAMGGKIIYPFSQDW